jgi:hypothetical protein
VHGLDIETANPEGGGELDPAKGRLRLVQISDGSRVQVYDAYKQPHELLRAAVEVRPELVAHNATFERRWLEAHLGVDLRGHHNPPGGPYEFVSLCGALSPFLRVEPIRAMARHMVERLTESPLIAFT